MPRIPAAFLVAIVVHAAFGLVRFIAMLGDGRPEWMMKEWWFLVMNGTAIASSALFAVGSFELARRLPAAPARGMKLAGAAFVLLCGLELAGGLIGYFSTGANARFIWDLEGYVSSALMMLFAIGVAIAAGRAAIVPVALLLVATFAQSAPPPIAKAIYEAFGKHSHFYYFPLRFAFLGVLYWSIREVARAATAAPRVTLAEACGLMGGALRIRLVAMIVLIGFTLIAFAGKSLGAMKLAMVGAPLVNVAAFLAFALGALRASRDVERGPSIALAVAGWASAWAGGVLAQQVPSIYAMLNGRDGDSYMGERHSQVAQALAVPMPLIATAGVLIAMIAISAYARSAGLLDVASRMVTRATLFVILMLVSVGVLTYLVPTVRSMDQYLLLAVISAVTGIIALVVAANAFREASTTVGATTALPTATALPPTEG